MLRSGNQVLLGEADLLPLQGRVPEGGDDDELVAVPFGGLAELKVERLSGRADHSAVGQRHLPGEGPGDVFQIIITEAGRRIALRP